jgi:hypothetical protein
MGSDAPPDLTASEQLSVDPVEDVAADGVLHARSDQNQPEGVITTSCGTSLNKSLWENMLGNAMYSLFSSQLTCVSSAGRVATDVGTEASADDVEIGIHATNLGVNQIGINNRVLAASMHGERLTESKLIDLCAGLYAVFDGTTHGRTNREEYAINIGGHPGSPSRGEFGALLESFDGVHGPKAELRQILAWLERVRARQTLLGIPQKNQTYLYDLPIWVPSTPAHTSLTKRTHARTRAPVSQPKAFCSPAITGR